MLADDGQRLANAVAGDAAVQWKELLRHVVEELALGRCYEVGSGRGHVRTITNMAVGQTHAEVLLVVPTLGRRPKYLRQTLESIVAQDIPVGIVIVAPADAEGISDVAREFGADVVADPGSLPRAINAGVAHGLTSRSYAFVNWLGDDDRLEAGSLRATTQALKGRPDAVVAFGACRYIDGEGRELWVSRAGRFAPWVLSWGPDLIPQPGMLVRADAWQRVGGVDDSYRLAFDLDLLLKLKKIGRLVNTGAVVSSFRWHAESLTVDDRSTNLAESERAKRAALSPAMRKVAWLWEAPVRVATRAAANEVSRRARRAAAANAPA